MGRLPCSNVWHVAPYRSLAKGKRTKCEQEKCFKDAFETSLKNFEIIPDTCETQAWGQSCLVNLHHLWKEQDYRDTKKLQRPDELQDASYNRALWARIRLTGMITMWYPSTDERNSRTIAWITECKPWHREIGSLPLPCVQCILVIALNDKHFLHRDSQTLAFHQYRRDSLWSEFSIGLRT